VALQGGHMMRVDAITYSPLVSPRDRAHAQKLVQNAEGYLLNNFFFALASSLSWCSTASVECFAGSLWKKQINSGESA
jgi:hypothetical protein